MVAIKVLAFDGEQHMSIVGRHDEHHRGFLADAKSVFIHNDFHATVAVAQLGGSAGGNPDSGFCVNVVGEGGLVNQAEVLARPGNPVIAFPLGREGQRGHPIRIGF